VVQSDFTTCVKLTLLDALPGLAYLAAMTLPKSGRGLITAKTIVLACRRG
jgi:hypothetical protein